MSKIIFFQVDFIYIQLTKNNLLENFMYNNICYLKIYFINISKKKIFLNIILIIMNKKY